MGNRIVGYYEYAKALEAFSELIKISTDQEIKVYNQILSSRSEFDIFTNLARGLEPQNSTLKFEAEKLNDDFRRTGLSWLMSLARVEFATTRSVFQPDSNPFLEVAPENEESLIYFKILLDSFKSHFYDTINSNELELAIKSSRVGPSQTVFAYTRRLSLMADMYLALMNVERDHFTPEQYAEFTGMGKKIHQSLTVITLNVSANMQKSGTEKGALTSTNTQAVYRSCTAKCKEIAKLSGF